MAGVKSQPYKKAVHTFQNVTRKGAKIRHTLPEGFKGGQHACMALGCAVVPSPPAPSAGAGRPASRAAVPQSHGPTVGEPVGVRSRVLPLRIIIPSEAKHPNPARAARTHPSLRSGLCS